MPEIDVRTYKRHCKTTVKGGQTWRQKSWRSLSPQPRPAFFCNQAFSNLENQRYSHVYHAGRYYCTLRLNLFLWSVTTESSRNFLPPRLPSLCHAISKLQGKFIFKGRSI
jgi:hypothetical protein